AVPGRGVWPGAAACAAQRAAAGTAAGGGRDHRRQSRRLPGGRVQRRGRRRRAVSPGSGTGADAGERAAVRRGMAGAFAMKITRLTTWHAPPRWLFLKIEADEGISGWGEPVIEGRAATVEAAVHELGELLVGRDPAHINDLDRKSTRLNSS